MGALLFSWRNDDVYGKGWQPGGGLRIKECLADRCLSYWTKNLETNYGKRRANND